MKKLFYSYTAILSMLMLTACNSDLDIPVNSESELTAKLIVEQAPAMTRAAINDTRMIQGDSVGVFLSGYENKYMNVPAECSGYSYYSPMKLEKDIMLTSERTMVSAFYPYQRTAEGMIHDIDVESQTNYLYGKSSNDIYNHNATASIMFKHVMARIAFKVTYKEGVTLTKLQLLGDSIFKKAKFDLEKDTITDLSQQAINTDTLNIPISSKVSGSKLATVEQDVLLIPSLMGEVKLCLSFSNNRKFEVDIVLPETTSGSYYTYPITIKEDPYNAIEFIDLGLSVKWALCNLGATAPEEAGNYYAWGETTPKTTYNYATYKWGNGSDHIDYSKPQFYTKYNTLADYGNEGYTDDLIEIEKTDDAAYTAYHGHWRLPTYEEMQELIEKCRWTWTTLNGVPGFRVESMDGQQSIFLPAAGTMADETLSASGSYGLYYTSTLNPENPNYAYELSFYNAAWGMAYGIGNGMRQYGRSIRPVAK